MAHRLTEFGRQAFRVLATRQSDPLLRRLAKHPCGDLHKAAQQILAGRRKGSSCGFKVTVPGVLDPVSIRFVDKKSKRCYGLYDWGKHKVVIYTKGRRKTDILGSLIHEMRHVQQYSILGYDIFSSQTHGAQICTAFEIDAFASQFAFGYNPYEEYEQVREADIQLVIKRLKQTCVRHAKLIGK
jgi:hypothetical protein